VSRVTENAAERSFEACHQVKRRTWVQLILALGTGKGEAATTSKNQTKPASELFAIAKNFFHFVPLSGGGYADPRWTTTLLTAFDSRSEARVLEFEA